MKILKTIAYIIELLSIVLFFIINHLSNTETFFMKQALENNKILYESHISETLAFLMLIIFFLIAVINMILISRKRFRRGYEINLSVLIIVASAAAVKCFNVRNLFTYYYLLIAMFIIIICEAVKVCVNLKFKPD